MTKYFVQDGDNYVAVDDTLHTQSDVDRIVKERAERIARQQFPDYDQLKETATKVETIKTEYEEKLTAASTAKTELEKQLGKAQLETERVKAIHEFKLSDEASEFVTGDSAEEIRKRAEKLSKVTTGGSLPIDKSGKPEDKPSNSKKIATQLFGKSDD